MQHLKNKHISRLSSDEIVIKICCIKNFREAHMALEVGADALGLVSSMPSGPGVISEVDIARIIESIDPEVPTFLLTSQRNEKSITDQLLLTRANTLQLVDRIERDVIDAVRKTMPDIHLVQVVHVRDQSAIDEALLAATYADYILLDSGNPMAAVKELGGTGRVHDWRISAEIVKVSPVPVFLAGGLHAGNVREAVAAVKPYGVDLCSGVRTRGQLDQQKLTAFMKVIRKASLIK